MLQLSENTLEMNMKSIFITILTVMLFNSQSWAEGKSSLSCTSGNDKRELQIQEADQGCKLLYTKGGEAKEVATQKIGKDKCNEVLEKIQKKLEDSSYKCAEETAKAETPTKVETPSKTQ